MKNKSLLHTSLIATIYIFLKDRKLGSKSEKNGRDPCIKWK
jgi:hypothetical protein